MDLKIPRWLGRRENSKKAADQDNALIDTPEHSDVVEDDDGRFNPCPPEAWDLFRCDSDETRERWRFEWQRERRRLARWRR